MMICGPCCLVCLELRQYYNPFCCLCALRAQGTFTFYWARSKRLGKVRQHLHFFFLLRQLHRLLLKTWPLALLFVAGLLRLKGEYDPTPDLEEMRKEKEAADKEPRVSILSLVRVFTGKG